MMWGREREGNSEHFALGFRCSRFKLSFKCWKESATKVKRVSFEFALIMKVTVVTPSGRELFKGHIELTDSATVADLQKKIYERTQKFYPSRQRLTLPIHPGSTDQKPTVLDPNKRLKDYCDILVSNKFTVVFEDLGPQVSYRSLYFWGYLGPMIIYPIFYYFSSIYRFFGYKEERVIHPVQTYACYYWCFHYFKCIMETFFVHRYGHATSPLSNVYDSCASYWTFGAFVGYYVNHPLYQPIGEVQWKIGFGFGLVCQVANFYCHILWKNLWGPNGVERYQIPRGFLFDFVTCPHYTTEIFQWIGFITATRTTASYVLLIVGFGSMTNSALAMHQHLNKIFDGKDGRPKYPRRWIILPPFL